MFEAVFTNCGRLGGVRVLGGKTFEVGVSDKTVLPSLGFVLLKPLQVSSTILLGLGSIVCDGTVACTLK